jgi:hypothetical protein
MDACMFLRGSRWPNISRSHIGGPAGRTYVLLGNRYVTRCSIKKRRTYMPSAALNWVCDDVPYVIASWHTHRSDKLLSFRRAQGCTRSKSKVDRKIIFRCMSIFSAWKFRVSMTCEPCLQTSGAHCRVESLLISDTNGSWAVGAWMKLLADGCPYRGDHRSYRYISAFTEMYM